MNELGIRALFNAFVSGEQLPSKPDPAIFLKAARLLALPPTRCIVIEDTPVGIQGAHRAGMRCIAVTNTHTAQALQGADIITEGLDRLPPDAFEHLFTSPVP